MNTHNPRVSLSVIAMILIGSYWHIYNVILHFVIIHVISFKSKETQPLIFLITQLLHKPFSSMVCFQPFSRKSSSQKNYFSSSGIGESPLSVWWVSFIWETCFLVLYLKSYEKLTYALARYWTKQVPGGKEVEIYKQLNSLR